MMTLNEFVSVILLFAGCGVVWVAAIVIAAKAQKGIEEEEEDQDNG